MSVFTRIWRSFRGGKQLKNYTRNFERLIDYALQNVLSSMTPAAAGKAIETNEGAIPRFLSTAIKMDLRESGEEWPSNVYADGFASGVNVCGPLLKEYFDRHFDSARNNPSPQVDAVLFSAGTTATLSDLRAIPRVVSFELFCSMHGLWEDKSLEQTILSGNANVSKKAYSLGIIDGFNALHRQVLPR